MVVWWLCRYKTSWVGFDLSHWLAAENETPSRYWVVPVLVESASTSASSTDSVLSSEKHVLRCWRHKKNLYWHYCIFSVEAKRASPGVNADTGEAVPSGARVSAIPPGRRPHTASDTGQISLVFNSKLCICYWHSPLSIWSRVYTVSQKTRHLTLAHNFTKY